MKPFFHPIDVSAFKLMQSYTLTSPMQNCDYAVANLCCWSFLYHSEYAVVDGWLLLRFCLEPHKRLAYMAPVGQGDLTKALHFLHEDAEAHGEPLCICGASDAMKVQLEGILPSHFMFINDRDFNDYIYNRESLATLVGKSLKNKRNHVNKFESLYPEAEYRELTPEWFDACMELESRWQKEQTADDGQSDERRAMEFAFAHYTEMGLRGGILLVNGQLVAFTYGSPINVETFGVHVEKANVDFEGAYTVINQQFVQHLPEQYIYVNREEDLGIDGLRQAKLSYKPAILLNKWMIVEKPIVESNAKLIEYLRGLWIDVFHDDNDFLNAFFARYFNRSRMLYTMQNDFMASSLYWLPVSVKSQTALAQDNQAQLKQQEDESQVEQQGQPDLKVAYIYAVGTHPDYREQGLMSLLIKRMKRRLLADDYDAAVLLPAEPWLVQYYQRFGFKEAPYLHFEPDENFSFLHEDGDEQRPLMLLPLHKNIEQPATLVIL